MVRLPLPWLLTLQAFTFLYNYYALAFPFTPFISRFFLYTASKSVSLFHHSVQAIAGITRYIPSPVSHEVWSGAEYILALPCRQAPVCSGTDACIDPPSQEQPQFPTAQNFSDFPFQLPASQILIRHVPHSNLSCVSPFCFLHIGISLPLPAGRQDTR